MVRRYERQRNAKYELVVVPGKEVHVHVNEHNNNIS